MDNQIDKVQKLREFADKKYSNGLNFGAFLSMGMVGLVDKLSDGSFDHPYLIGIPFAGLTVLNLCFYEKRGKDARLSKLEEELLQSINQ